MARASLCLIAFALCALAQVYCAAPPPSSNIDLSNLLKEFQASVDKAVAETKKNLNLPENPDGAAIVKAIREQSNKAEKAFEDMKKNLEESVKKNPEISGALDNLKAKIEEAKEKLKKDNPEYASGVQKLADSLKNGYESVGKEIEKINAEVNKKGGLRDDIDNLLKNLIDRGTASAKDFQKKVQEAVKDITEKKA